MAVTECYEFEVIEAALIVTFPKAPEKEFQGLALSLYFNTNYQKKRQQTNPLYT